MEFKRKEQQGDLYVKEHEIGMEEKLPLLHFKSLDDTGIVNHCFTTRMGGVSEGIFSSLNLSFTRGDEEAAVRENYRRIAKVFDVTETQFVFTDQTHTTNVRMVTEQDGGKGLVRQREYTDVDGLITNVPGLVLSTFFADCVPLYFVDPVQKAIGMSHSGWRGTVGRMGAKTIQAMSQAYGTDPADVICAIGPSICQDCYEVGADVADVFVEAFPEHKEAILYEREKYQLNLWKANELVLLEAGVRPEHIAVTDICTCCNPKLLFSHRASHGKRGNLAAFLCLKL